MQMCKAVQIAHTEAQINRLLGDDGRPQNFITFKISREKIVEDTIRETSKHNNLKKPLRIIFKNEEGVDEG